MDTQPIQPQSAQRPRYIKFATYVACTAGIAALGFAAGYAVRGNNTDSPSLAVSQQVVVKPESLVDTSVSDDELFRVLDKVATANGITLSSEVVAGLPADQAAATTMKINLLKQKLEPLRRKRIVNGVTVTMSNPESSDYQDRLKQVKSVLESKIAPVLYVGATIEVQSLISQELKSKGLTSGDANVQIDTDAAYFDYSAYGLLASQMAMQTPLLVTPGQATPAITTEKLVSLYVLKSIGDPSVFDTWFQLYQSNK